MIQLSQFHTLLKQGIQFSMITDDRVFTGDLFYDFFSKEFQIRGIPSVHGRMVNVLRKGVRTVALDLLVMKVIKSEPRDAELTKGGWMDLRFHKAKCPFAFATYIEETVNDELVMKAIEDHFELVDGLAWVSPHLVPKS